jgi:hypothetical protein
MTQATSNLSGRAMKPEDGRLRDEMKMTNTIGQREKLADELEGVISDLQSSGWARAPGCIRTLQRVTAALSSPPAGEGEPVGYAVEYANGTATFVRFDPATPTIWPFRAVFPRTAYSYKVTPLFAHPNTAGEVKTLTTSALVMAIQDAELAFRKTQSMGDLRHPDLGKYAVLQATIKAAVVAAGGSWK